MGISWVPWRFSGNQKIMKVKLWGVRGSITTTDPQMDYYGGNTSCISVMEEDSLLVLDGGSGMQRLAGNIELKNNRIDILLTHLHMDHIQGLGFFKYLFDSEMEIHIWGPASSSKTLHSRISRYLSPPLFPVLIRDLPCKLHLHEIGNSQFDAGTFKIQSRYVIHPGATVGYRVSGHKSVFTYLPDHEPALGRLGMFNDPKWLSGYDLAVNADLLLHDAQYTTEEYQSKKGWGHSSMEDAAKFAALSAVKHLLFSHHDPSHTDAKLNEMYDSFKKNSEYSFKYEMAREAMEFELA
jgi:ribonuclease BN (tRNA processing enzyme)